MKIGTLLMLIFCFCAGWKIQSDRHTKEARRTEVTLSGYNACVDNLYTPTDFDTVETKQNWIHARQVCADVWFGGNLN